jgi:hypothetical protein
MRRLSASLVTLGLIVIAGCAGSDVGNDTGTGGANSSGSAGATGNAGNGSGGNNAGGAGSSGSGTAGTSGSAGATGAGATGGTTGTAGSVATGTAGASGTTGNGGRGGNTGSAGRGGNSGAAGQSGSAGTGGTTAAGQGGSSGARGGSGGASGTAGVSGGGGSSGGLFTIMVQLASAMKSTAPTTVGIVTWSTTVSGVTAAHIDFGLDTTYGMTAPVDLTATGYRTLLLGMKPAKTYHFRVVATAGANTYTSDDQTVMTGAKINSTPISSFSVKSATANPKGFYITSFWNGTGSKVPFIFDSDGDVVWWYTAASSESTDGISRARMSADSQSIWLVNESLSGNPLRRVSIDGLTTQTYSNTKASHDICAVSGDTMAYLDYGESDCNSIFEINNAGTTKEVFEATNMTSTGTGMQNCHGNAVRYSKKEDQYTYSDWQKELAVISRAGVLQWKLTQKVSGGNTAWGGAQHGHQLLDNSIILFANNGAGTNKSQAIEYGLDGHLIKKFNSNGGATNFGDVQRLANGSTIITYSTSGLMQVVDANDTVVLEVKGSGSFGYVEFRDSLYGPPLDINQ